jgi:RNA polymerase sigma-54 factor
MLKQSLQQKLQQKLSPQQIQLMKLIQLPLQALEQRIKQEIEENPALEEPAPDFDEAPTEEYDEFDNEEDDGFIESEHIDIDQYLSDDETPNYKLQANNYSDDDEEPRYQFAALNTFTESLKQQLSITLADQKSKDLAEYLIGNLEDDGYLRRDLTSIVDDLAFSRNIDISERELEAALKLIQSLDPAGVGARDLQECLLLQLERKTHTPEINIAITILDEYFEEFTRKHYEKILRKLNATDEQLKKAVDEILKLNPKPGGSIDEKSPGAQVIVPDFYITIEDGKLSLNLNSRNAPELNISQDYKEMLKAYQVNKEDASRSQKEAVMFVKQKLDSAKWFIDAIKQRQQTLYLTMHSIMNYQKDYFLSGDERKLQPMILKDIADEVGMDISTISRVASSKYVQSPYGTHLLKSFFSESMTNEDGEEVSTKKIKKILQDLIEDENKSNPITDEALAEALKDAGFPIARRTVAKYREQLNIPVARLRKEL